MANNFEFEISERKIHIYPGPAGSPAVYLHSFEDDSDRIRGLMAEEDCPDHSLIAISHLNWNDDMTPWYCPPLSKNYPPCGGRADEWIKTLQEEIVPQAERKLEGAPKYRAIAGYSLAGLFAVYSLYRTDIFARAASVSGSLWYPDFMEYTRQHEMVRRPDCLYFSLGDREAHTRNPMLREVQNRTEAICENFRRAGLDTIFELNSGNHFQNDAERTVKGIRRILAR